MQLKNLLDQPNAQVIDVRETWEFEGGHVQGSKNIPMGDVFTHLDELRAAQGPLIFVCASGNRSGQVVAFLQNMDFRDIYNGGGWKAVDQARSALA